MSHVYKPSAGYRVVIEQDLFDLQASINDLIADVRPHDGYVEFVGSPVIKKKAVFQAAVIHYPFQEAA